MDAGSWYCVGAEFSDFLFTLFSLKSRIRKYGGFLRIKASWSEGYSYVLYSLLWLVLFRFQFLD